MAETARTAFKAQILPVYSRMLRESGIPDERVSDVAHAAYLAGAFAAETAKVSIQGSIRLLPAERRAAYRTAVEIAQIALAKEGAIPPLNGNDQAASDGDGWCVAAYREALRLIAQGHNDPRALATETLRTVEASYG